MLKKVRVNNLDNLVIGREYFVICGVWQGHVHFVTRVHCGRVTRYNFTFGPTDNWRNQFCIYSPKSKLKVYELKEV